MLREAKPDMIAITGNLIDSRRTNIAVALAFAEEAVQIAPCYPALQRAERMCLWRSTMSKTLSALTQASGARRWEPAASRSVSPCRTMTVCGATTVSMAVSGSVDHSSISNSRISLAK